MQTALNDALSDLHRRDDGRGAGFAWNAEVSGLSYVACEGAEASGRGSALTQNSSMLSTHRPIGLKQPLVCIIVVCEVFLLIAKCKDRNYILGSRHVRFPDPWALGGWAYRLCNISPLFRNTSYRRDLYRSMYASENFVKL